jgi:putative transposase
MRYRRIYIKGGTYSFTVVTYQRMNLFSEPANIESLSKSIEHVQKDHPFAIVAQVILPDHLHAIWELPEGDSNYPMRWYLIKSNFTRRYTREHGRGASQLQGGKGERKVWQRRYWEHTIRDDQDLDNHIDYIHFNPVHHGLVKIPGDWEYSTFKMHVQEGRYDPDWTMVPDVNIWKTAWG